MGYTEQANDEITTKIADADAAARVWHAAAKAWETAPTDENSRALDAAVKAYYETCSDLHLAIGSIWRQGLRLCEVNQ